MTTSNITLDEVLTLAHRLSPFDQARLIARLAPAIENALDQTRTSPAPTVRPSAVRGLLASLGPAPSAEDIAEVQRDMWATFPSESI